MKNSVSQVYFVTHDSVEHNMISLIQGRNMYTSHPYRIIVRFTVRTAFVFTSRNGTVVSPLYVIIHNMDNVS